MWVVPVVFALLLAIRLVLKLSAGVSVDLLIAVSSRAKGLADPELVELA